MTSSNDAASWVLVAVPLATVVAAVLAARTLYREIKLKQVAETRLAEASRAEADARLMATFVALMAKAHARGDSAAAEQVIAALIISQSPLTPTTLTAVTELVESAMVTHPVGAGEQEAAIAAVAELGQSP